MFVYLGGERMHKVTYFVFFLFVCLFLVFGCAVSSLL